MPTYRLDLSWDGTAYSGWQVQPSRHTIQAQVELALSRIFNEKGIRVTAAGRTDSGVHALQQVASFQSQTDRSEAEVLRGLNGLLPADIACSLVQKVPAGFQARYATKEKMYRYRLLNRQHRCPFRFRQTWHICGELDLDAMREAGELMVGTHNVAAFQARGCSAAHTIRTLRSFRIQQDQDEIHLEWIGNGFLRHQVRIMTGTLVSIGRAQKSVPLMTELLRTGDRRLAGRTAPAQGLWLIWTRLEQNTADLT